MNHSAVVTTLCAACDAVIALGDDPKADAVAGLVLQRYRDLDDSERPEFFEALASSFGADHDAVERAMSKLTRPYDPADVWALGESTRPARQQLFSALNAVDGGTSALLAMRADLSQHLRSNAELAAVDRDLLHLFESWFNRGFLELTQLTWGTPARVLERLIDYEAVHEISGFDDLRRRLDARDRRIFAYFHPALPGDPIIFVEVALTVGLATSVDVLLEEPDPDASGTAEGEGDVGGTYDTAIFYSITNCQAGLRGVSFGDALIKNVMRRLSDELPQLTTFSTLSPVPGLRQHLRDADVLTRAGVTTFERARLERADVDDVDLQALAPLNDTIRAACASYLVAERSGPLPLDPVARFHLRNGARLERINWGADSSANGIAQSYGVMVNYLYDPHTVDENRERLVHHGEVAHSPEVAELRRAEHLRSPT